MQKQEAKEQCYHCVDDELAYWHHRSSVYWRGDQIPITAMRFATMSDINE